MQTLPLPSGEEARVSQLMASDQAAYAARQGVESNPNKQQNVGASRTDEFNNSVTTVRT